jgi:hypothetical protein
MHCCETFDQHTIREDERWCRDGQRRFNVEFHVNPELVAFLQANPDKTTRELTELWIERLRRRGP